MAEAFRIDSTLFGLGGGGEGEGQLIKSNGYVAFVSNFGIRRQSVASLIVDSVIDKRILDLL